MSKKIPRRTQTGAAGVLFGARRAAGRHSFCMLSSLNSNYSSFSTSQGTERDSLSSPRSASSQRPQDSRPQMHQLRSGTSIRLRRSCKRSVLNVQNVREPL